MKHVYTIAASDVGKPTITFGGVSWLVSSFLGQILPGDVGKRVFLNRGTLQIENKQRAKRTDYRKELARLLLYATSNAEPRTGNPHTRPSVARAVDVLFPGGDYSAEALRRLAR